MKFWTFYLHGIECDFLKTAKSRVILEYICFDKHRGKKFSSCTPCLFKVKIEKGFVYIFELRSRYDRTRKHFKPSSTPTGFEPILTNFWPFKILNIAVKSIIYVELTISKANFLKKTRTLWYFCSVQSATSEYIWKSSVKLNQYQNQMSAFKFTSYCVCSIRQFSSVSELCPFLKWKSKTRRNSSCDSSSAPYKESPN